VGNKCDLPNKIVSYQDQDEYSKLMGLKFFETSAKENINIDEVFIELSKMMLQKQMESQRPLKQDGPIRIGKSGDKRESKKQCCK
jgi:hypothetical protein